MEEEQSSRKRARDEPASAELEFDSAEVKRLREDLLFSLDDSDHGVGQEEEEGREDHLVSVMKSFEEEISAPSSPSPAPAAESLPELGYLLEASDDELGIPPANGSVGPDDLWSLEGEFPNYDAFEMGVYEYGGHVAQFDSSSFDYSDMYWRLGTLPSD